MFDLAHGWNVILGLGQMILIVIAAIVLLISLRGLTKLIVEMFKGNKK